jgi:hypothetical protein
MAAVSGRGGSKESRWHCCSRRLWNFNFRGRWQLAALALLLAGAAAAALLMLLSFTTDFSFSCAQTALTASACDCRIDSPAGAAAVAAAGKLWRLPTTAPSVASGSAAPRPAAQAANVAAHTDDCAQPETSQDATGQKQGIRDKILVHFSSLLGQTVLQARYSQWRPSLAQLSCIIVSLCHRQQRVCQTAALFSRRRRRCCKRTGRCECRQKQTAREQHLRVSVLRHRHEHGPSAPASRMARVFSIASAEHARRRQSAASQRLPQRWRR